MLSKTITSSPGTDNFSVAAVDLGSNSFHMLVTRVNQGELRPVEALGEHVQLAAGLHKGRLTAESMTRGLHCLTQFSQALAVLKPDAVRVVATNTLRAAKNAAEFTARASTTLGYPVEVISGREEARLIYLGVAHTLADDDRARLMIDIGGGSTEVVIGKRFKARLTESLHMGCVSWREQFFPNGHIKRKAFERAYQAAYLEVLNIRKAYRRRGWDNVVGSSGTLNAIADVLTAQSGEKREITRADLEQLKVRVLGFNNVDELATIKGLKERRRSVFPGGLAICCALFDALEIDLMITSRGALREGVAYELLGRLAHEDVRERTVNAMMERSHVDIDNAERVEEVAAHLFKEIQKSWQLSDADGDLLSWAARLHEIGLSIAHSQFHKHGQYLINNADLPGFSLIEQQALGILVRGHRRKFPVSVFNGLPPGERLRLERLCVLLRLAVLFKYVESAEGMPRFNMKARSYRCDLDFPAQWLSRHPLTEAQLRIEQNYLRKANYQLQF